MINGAIPVSVQLIKYAIYASKKQAAKFNNVSLISRLLILYSPDQRNVSQIKKWDTVDEKKIKKNKLTMYVTRTKGKRQTGENEYKQTDQNNWMRHKWTSK